MPRSAPASPSVFVGLTESVFAEMQRQNGDIPRPYALLQVQRAATAALQQVFPDLTAEQVGVVVNDSVEALQGGEAFEASWRAVLIGEEAAVAPRISPYDCPQECRGWQVDLGARVSVLDEVTRACMEFGNPVPGQSDFTRDFEDLASAGFSGFCLFPPEESYRVLRDGDERLPALEQVCGLRFTPEDCLVGGVSLSGWRVEVPAGTPILRVVRGDMLDEEHPCLQLVFPGYLWVRGAMGRDFDRMARVAGVSRDILPLVPRRLGPLAFVQRRFSTGAPLRSSGRFADLSAQVGRLTN